MEENRKTLTWVSLAGVLILAMMIVYPGVMDRISEYRKEEISLAGEQKLSAPQQGEAGTPQKLQTEEMPEILLSVEGENEPDIFSCPDMPETVGLFLKRPMAAVFRLEAGM